MAAAQDDPQLMGALAARARGEVDFVMTIASLRKMTWEDALAAYVVVFKREADAILRRVAAARDRRRAR